MELLRPDKRAELMKMSKEEIVDYIGQKMQDGAPKLLWGTANLFTHRRFMAGAATVIVLGTVERLKP